MTDDWSQAEIVRALGRIERGQEATNARLDTLSGGFVPRGEFDALTQAMGREIGEIKKDLDARRVPAWTVASLIITGLGATIALILAVAGRS